MQVRLNFVMHSIIAVFLTLSVAAASNDASAQTYADWLESQDEAVMVRRYQNQQEIDEDIHGQPDPDKLSYDATLNGAKFKFTSASARQIRPSFPAIERGTVLFTWEGRWGEGFSRDGDIDGLRIHKAFQISRNGPSDQRRMEIRTSFSSVDRPNVAKIDHRRYIWEGDGPAEGIPQIEEFIIEPNTWTRFWSFIDFDRGVYSHWVADENREPVQLFDRLPLKFANDLANGVDNFWFAFNSSQSRDGPVIYTWARNFAVLKDLKNGPEFYVQIGAKVDADIRGDIPKNLIANE